MTEDEIEEAVEYRNELEETIGVFQAVINKLNQFIEGESTEEELDEWMENNDEMFDMVSL